MKKCVTMLLIFTILMSVVACGNNTPAPTEPSQPTTPTEPLVQGYPLNDKGECIVNDGGTITSTNDGSGRVFYQIFVGSFSDSNGDGIGDLRGIINRFDYLNDGDPNSGVSLGVEGIWLSPIFTSPTYHKYDATNYYEIDPDFGTMEDLQELINLCHSRGVQIILDLVINHTAKKHEWFEEFVYAHQMDIRSGKYYDFYSWADTNLPGATYNTIPGTSQYYECNFSGDMPELNFDNEDVRQAMVDVAKFYLDMGVDGFRFDAAKYIYYGDESSNSDFWIWYMTELRNIKPDIYTVAEVWDSDSVTHPYFASTNCFNFTMAGTSGLLASVGKGGDVDNLTTYVQEYLNTIHGYREDAMMCTFLANHDMDRAAGYLTVNNGYAYVGANISMLMPGSTFIYYGDEIGMKGSRGGAPTDANRRLAMLWGDGDTVKNPTGTTYNSTQINGTVADQLGNSDSLYNHYKKLVMIRKANPEIVYGSYTALTLEDSKAGGFLSQYEGKTVAVIHNPTTETVTIDLTQLTDASLTTLAAFAGVGKATLEGTTLILEPQTSAILR